MDIYLKTAFAFMACDGEIVKEEIDLIKDFAKDGMFETTNADEYLKELVSLLNDEGSAFLQEYLDEVEQEQLNHDEALRLLRIAVGTIYADHDVKYSEVRFFRALRKRLPVLDDFSILFTRKSRSQAQKSSKNLSPRERFRSSNLIQIFQI